MRAKTVQNKDSIVWEVAYYLLMFGVLPCALFTGGAYLYLLYFTPPPYAGVTLEPDVSYVSARRFETHGLETLTVNGKTIDLVPWTADRLDTSLGPTVTVLVHGYNAQEHKVASYFAELTSYLRSNGPYEGAIVVFDWPAAGTPLDELPAAQRIQLDMQNPASQPGYELAMYGADQQRAADTGARSFLSLIDGLSTAPARTIVVIGHSMGCYVLAEAMKRAPSITSRIASMVWLAPDVDQAILDQPWFHTAADRMKGGLHVYFSRNDTVLKRLSRFANGTPRLGATGAGATRKPPGNVELIDMTADLPGNAHTGYLAKGSPGLEHVAKQISAAGKPKP